MVNPSTYPDDHEARLSEILGAQADDTAGDYFYEDRAADDTADPFLFGDPDLLKLGIALEFGPDELASNRDGYLAPSQLKFLEHDLRWKYWPLIILATVFAFAVGTAGLITAPGGGLLALIPVVILLVVSAVMAFLLKHERESLPDRYVYSTVVEVGWLGLTLRRWGVTGSENGHAHFTGIGGKKLFAQKEVHNAMQANQIYRAYYVPGLSWSRARILSLEPINEPLKRSDIRNKKAKIKNTF